MAHVSDFNEARRTFGGNRAKIILVAEHLDGVTVESERQIKRIPHLLSTKAHLKWLCLEPLLSAVPNLPLNGIHWVILGGESGLKARPLREEWVTNVRDQCLANKVSFYFKQWGGFNKKATDCLLQGREWKQVPKSALRFY